MAEQIEILVVDDDKEIANLVEIYLSSTGYKIHKAYNAVDGLALLQKYDIKLAIIDVMMPQIDGIEIPDGVFLVVHAGIFRLLY